MDKSDVIYLISKSLSQDGYGVQQVTETKRRVFCKVDSVTANEFFEGGRNGIQAQYRMTMNRFDYNNELVIEYNNQRYGVYRTYIQKNDNIELYVEYKKGVE